MKKKKEDPTQPTTGQCAKDSDCGVGEVCVNGRCVQDITPPTTTVNPK